MKVLKTEKRNSYREDVYRKFGRVFEQSLSRVWQHTKKGFFIITAFTPDFTEEENLQRNQILKKDLRDYGLGFFEVDGVYRYKATGIIESELSYFVPKYKYSNEEIKEIAIELCGEHKQETVIYIDDTGTAFLLYPNGKEVKIGNNFNPDQIADNYSRLRGRGSHRDRTFFFEGLRKPAGMCSAIEMKLEGSMF